jgi:hypothetical protein
MPRNVFVAAVMPSFLPFEMAFRIAQKVCEHYEQNGVKVPNGTYFPFVYSVLVRRYGSFIKSCP